jgi:hypothetical protein
MSKEKQIIIKQFFVIGSFVVLSYVIIFISNHTNTGFASIVYELLTLVSMIMACVYVPLGMLYVRKLEKSGDLTKLNLVFRIVSWVFLYFFLFAFLCTYCYEFMYDYYGDGVWKYIVSGIHYRISSSYFLDIEYGFVHELLTMFNYSGLLVCALLFYIAIRINRTSKATGYTNDKNDTLLKRHPKWKWAIVIPLYVIVVVSDFYSSILDGGITRNDIILLLILTLSIILMNWKEEEDAKNEEEDDDDD